MQSNNPDAFIAPQCDAEIEILFQDKYLLIINKPTGLLSLSGKNPLNQDSVHYRMVQEYPTATLVHRLDLGTSGLMLLALNKEVNANLSKQFQARSISKTYTAILDGHLKENRGSIDMPIAKDKPNFPHLKICNKTGKPARSNYKVVKRIDYPKSSRVLFSAETGRTHQLRIHSQAIGHPILGCDLYGSKETQAMSDRLMLHATTLEFDHPITSERIRSKCACPF